MFGTVREKGGATCGADDVDQNRIGWKSGEVQGEATIRCWPVVRPAHAGLVSILGPTGRKLRGDGHH